MPTLTGQEWMQQVRAEHHALDLVVAELRSLGTVPAHVTGERPAAGALADGLVQLHHELCRHFRFEEEGGMIDDLLVGSPASAPRVRAVVDQHPLLLRDTRALATAALAIEAGQAGTFASLAERVESLLTVLEHHEQEEIRLVQRLAYRDLGSVD